MKLAETVTFGGSGLDRAAHLRGNQQAMETAGKDPASRTVLFWRGKPLVNTARPARLVRLPLAHPVIAALDAPRIFLGRENGAAVFAADLTGWMPEGLDAASMQAFLDTSEQQHPDLPEGEVFAELRKVMSWLSPRDAELAATAKAVMNWHETHLFCAKCGQPSRMAQSGWQRDCPSCKASHFPRTDPVVIMLITRGNSVLMGRSPGWPKGMYSLLAGFVEPGETIEAAVRREIWEEAGIKVGEVGYLASQPWPFPASLMMGCRGTALSHDIQIDPQEIEDARWLSREEIMTAFTGSHPEILPARKGSIAHFLLENWLADRLD